MLPPSDFYGNLNASYGVVCCVLVGGAIELVELESVVFGAPVLDPEVVESPDDGAAGEAACEDEDALESGAVLVLLLVVVLWSEDMPDEVDSFASCLAHAASKATVAIPRLKLTRFIGFSPSSNGQNN